MRILAITNCFPCPSSPLRALFHLHKMRAMAKENQVRLIVPVPWPEQLRHRLRGGAASLEFNEPNLRVYYPTYWFTPRILQHRYGGFFLASIRGAVRDALRDFQPEIVFAIWSHPDGWAAVQIARELKLPVVIKVIGSDVLVISENPRRRKMVAEALRAADHVIAVNRHLADATVELGVDRGRVHIIQEGIDKQAFQPGDQQQARGLLGLPKEGRIILFVGNLLFSKGAGVLIDACSILSAKSVPFTCYLVGRGKDEAKLRQMVKRGNLSKCVVIPGPCRQDVLVNWYRACDIVALPSFSEGIPNVLREAMQCHRPFVATRVGGIPEISDPATTHLVAPGDARELAEALEQMLQAPPRVDESVAGRYNITWEQSFQKIKELFDIALQQHSGSEVPIRETAATV
ncbi:MAG TPA: glycosyltransferase [Tepidisphaeraceae bacterium]|nr:glycosyltransferase [Tepidisphaeraceae bacterium]